MSTTVRVTFSTDEYAALRIRAAKRRMTVPNMVAADTMTLMFALASTPAPETPAPVPDVVVIAPHPRRGSRISDPEEQARLKKLFGDA